MAKKLLLLASGALEPKVIKKHKTAMV